MEVTAVSDCNEISGECDCDYGGSPERASFSYEVGGTTWIGNTAYTFEQEIKWKYITCYSMPTWDTSYCTIEEPDIRVSTDNVWSFNGLTICDMEVGTPDYNFTAYAQASFSGPSIGGTGYFADPYIELKGSFYDGKGEVIDADSGDNFTP
jgi:hypothetical protein